MLVFHSPVQAKHHSHQFMRHGRFVPTRDVPARADNILAELTRDGHAIHQARPHGMAPIAAIHTPEFLNFLETAWAEWRRIDGAAEEVMPYVFPVRGMDYGYPTHVIARAGYHAHDLWMPIGEHSHEAALASANLAVEAAARVLEGERAAYALCRPSGHHAFADMAGGNCFLNNAAIAAQHLRQRFGRVALVDIDVHHGNGTQGIFYGREDVLFVSLHRDPIDYHPFFCGYAQERGEGRGLGYNLNLPLPARSGDEAYLAALETACRRIAAYGAEALVVSLGVDGHEDDPTEGLAITHDGFRRIMARLAALNLPSVLVQEGGYNIDTIARCVGSALRGFEGREIAA
ncbi:histone deacetylase family protein [Rhodovarius crocodyli]|uniref:Histone deacetylase family protein n=1 Tax=Rhodovarius crocodyli TaxID=1979269 RepID=A0A437MDG7_9PROT|nr:histone deacetylase family protein [Rhodovarius crocodyli]RVT95685.1 histone deacetylase family protein [Rhodovarius crocodyli]